MGYTEYIVHSNIILLVARGETLFLLARKPVQLPSSRALRVRIQYRKPYVILYYYISLLLFGLGARLQ